jgi:hypothetical protein
MTTDFLRALAVVEASGAKLRLDDNGVRIWYPDDRCRETLAEQVALLRTERARVAARVAAYVRTRAAIPPM